MKTLKQNVTNLYSTTLATGMALALALSVTSPASHALVLSQVPLYVSNNAEPNIILSFDDSGSMTWGYMPDSIDNNHGQRYACSSKYNGIYYNPDITYIIPPAASGTAYTPSFTSARDNGFDSASATINLSTSFRVTWDPPTYYTVAYATCGDAVNTGRAAFYYTYNAANAGCTGVTTDSACYTRVTVSSTSGPGGTDERQNFANWFSYYRTRMLAAKSAAGRAFSQLNTTIRLAYQRINSCNGGLGAAPTATCPGLSVRPFSGANRTNFFTWLYGSTGSGTTPLRSAFVRAGDYLTTTNSNSPWAENPGTSVGTEHSCRQNFHVAFTDGMWNGETGSIAVGNDDNTNATFPDGQAYTAPGPAGRQIYGDANSNTLGDIAFKYWRTDARALTNNVPKSTTVTSGTADENYFNPVNDPANWQHLVNFTVGLGMQGTRTYPTDYNALLAGTLTWGAPNATVGSDDPDNVDDLWHAAVNSRGKYFSAQNPNELVDAFVGILNSIADRTSSAASLGVNGSTLNTETRIYQPTYNSGSWSGQLLAYRFNTTTGTLVTPHIWDAGTIINGLNYLSGRAIITYNPTLVGNKGVAFSWSSLSAAQQNSLHDDPTTGAVDNDGKGSARLDYLRGSTADEGTGNNFRVRSVSKLGDIVNSTPLYVGKSLFNWPDQLEGSTAAESYYAFKSTNNTRKPVLYVGSNDGMLHAIDATVGGADEGKEILAYVPNAVYKNLSKLTNPSYTHQYYVDGSPNYGDVFFGGSWKTVLVGGLNSGGQAIYALNITSPGSFSQANAGNIAMWEYTDADLGFTFSQPVIARVKTSSTGRAWVAIFGNGYNNSTEADGDVSATGYGYLYVVKIEDGTLLAKISTKTGTAAVPNGLAKPFVLDYDGDYVADYVYAGDLQGNVWKFDLTDNNPNNWGTFYGNAATPRPLFVAKDAAGTVQPITAPVQVTDHPDGLGGVMVYFGTGKYLEVGDNNTVGAQTQTFYGIWDKNVSGTSTPVARADLLAQTVTSTTINYLGKNYDYRLISDTPITWRTSGSSNYLGWRMDLPDSGERVVSYPSIRTGVVTFVTITPSTDPCAAGGYSWVMSVDARNGGALDSSPYDTNGDGVINAADNIPSGAGTAAPGGYRKSGGGGIVGTPIYIDGAGNGTSLECGDGLGAMVECKKKQDTKGVTGRQSWRQIK